MRIHQQYNQPNTTILNKQVYICQRKYRKKKMNVKNAQKKKTPQKTENKKTKNKINNKRTTNK